MIIRDFDLIGIAFTPLKTDTPLVVDTDAVLPGAVAGKFLQSVTWRYIQIIQPFGRIQNGQFSPGYFVQVCRESF